MAWRVIVRYNPDRDGMEEIACGIQLRQAVTKIATGAMAFAASTSPDGFEGYEHQFELDVDVIPDIPFRLGNDPPMARVAAAVVNQSRLAVLVEVGSKNSEEYRILTRTLRWIDLQGKAGL